MEFHEAVLRVPAWHEKRFPGASSVQMALKMCTEAGEVADAVLADTSQEGYDTGKGDFGSEAADVIICLLALRGRYYPTVDLMAEIHHKLTMLETPGAHRASLPS
jgi:L-alanine-DL-glutamate epimerase-like enolase superfamily enzyme